MASLAPAQLKEGGVFALSLSVVLVLAIGVPLSAPPHAKQTFQGELSLRRARPTGLPASLLTLIGDNRRKHGRCGGTKRRQGDNIPTLP